MVTILFQPLSEGEEIHLSRPPIFLGLILCAVGWFLCLVTLIAPESWLDRTELPIIRRVVAAAGVIGFAFGAYQSALPWLRKRRLLLGKDRLQLLEGDHVLGQVPYDNIARAVVDQVGGGLGVLVLLHDYQRTDTCWDNPPGFHDYYKRTKGFDLFIKDFREYPEVLRRKILSHCQEVCPAQSPAAPC